MRRAPICRPICRRIRPTARVNPADAPIMILGLTSDKYDVTQVYDLASTILEQKLSQIQGVGQVFVGGGATPSVRVEVDPKKLESFGLTLGNVQSMLSLQNSHEPRGQLSDGTMTEDIITNDQISEAEQYKPLIIGYHNGAAVRLSDVADVIEFDPEYSHRRVHGWHAGGLHHHLPPAGREHHSDRRSHHSPSCRFLKPFCRRASRPRSCWTAPRRFAPRSSNVERTLIGSIILVVLVVFVFLRSPRATLIPSVAVPVSLIGTFAVMYLLGYRLDNLSLMALTIATGFVVDDAIVVMENITRHLESGHGAVRRSAARAPKRSGSRCFRSACR